MAEIIKQYKALLVSLVLLLAVFLINKETGIESIKLSGNILLEMLSILPPIFILLGLLDVWVPRSTMVSWMGEKSGITGTILAFIIGSAAAGPLYGAFPVAAVLLRKGASFRNVMVFIGAWSTTKIPMLVFEFTAMGTKFALTRLLVDIIGILIMASVINGLVSKSEKLKIIENLPG